MIFSRTKPSLIIGESSALFVDGDNHKTLQNPQEISTLKISSALTVYVDFPGAIYSTHPYPKLSRFEVRAAIQNHPNLQEKEILSASAKITKKGELSLCTFKNNALLNTWLKALAHQKTPLGSVCALPFYKAYEAPPKALYQIEKTHDDRARHTCLIDGAIIFVRYTNLGDNIEAEISKTSQFIQRDYALDRADIQLENKVT